MSPTDGAPRSLFLAWRALLLLLLLQLCSIFFVRRSLFVEQRCAMFIAILSPTSSIICRFQILHFRIASSQTGETSRLPPTSTSMPVSLAVSLSTSQPEAPSSLELPTRNLIVRSFLLSSLLFSLARVYLRASLLEEVASSWQILIESALSRQPSH